MKSNYNPLANYPKGKPDRSFARDCIRHTKLSDAKIARITFCTEAEVRDMRERHQEPTR